MERIQNSGPMGVMSEEGSHKHENSQHSNNGSSLQHSARQLSAKADGSSQISPTGHDGVPLEPATSSPSISSAYIHDEASTSSLSVNAGSYTSASETSHHDMDSEDTSPNPAQSTSLFSVNDGGSTVHHSTLSLLNTTLRPTDSRSHTSDFQLQLWIYETSPTNQTLAEHLEQINWEGNYPTPAKAPTNRRTPHTSGI